MRIPPERGTVRVGIGAHRRGAFGQVYTPSLPSKINSATFAGNIAIASSVNHVIEDLSDCGDCGALFFDVKGYPDTYTMSFSII